MPPKTRALPTSALPTSALPTSALPASALPPSRAALHEAALASLARSAGTAATLRRALERTIARWAQRAGRAGRDPELVASDVETCREAAEAVIARLREVGLLDDSAFAAARAQSLSRAGRSRRAISAHLSAKGVAAEIVRDALPTDPEGELDAALALAKKRRIGPFARDERAESDRSLGMLARAGFDWTTARRALGLGREEAERRLQERRR